MRLILYFITSVVFSVFFYYRELWIGILYNDKTIIFAIGILSARENFIQREVARLTWLEDYTTKDSEFVKTWFILGNSSCNIPPEYRLSKYSCEKWSINVTGLEKSQFSSKEIKLGECKEIATVYPGFTFKVNHPIVITKLGIISEVFKLKSKVTVAILDIQSKEVIAQCTIFSNSSVINNGYIYASIESLLFPKGYEGLVLLEGYVQHSVCSTMQWNDGGGVISYKRIYTTPHHADSKPYSTDVFSVVSIQFYIDGLDQLKSIANEEAVITKKWISQLKEEEEKITLEKLQHGDLIVVDSVDTYRNLPIKILKFYKWLQLNQKFSYVMKTDDDSMININLLFEKLTRNRQFASNKSWLWSRFRKDWPVNYIGKWSDDDYKSSYYPFFPCGAAYIIPQQLAAWLSENSDFLHPYQGEDVSVGIWLSAINPILIEDEHFECDFSCTQGSYNRAQMKPDDMYKAWAIFKKCKNLCTCYDEQ